MEPPITDKLVQAQAHAEASNRPTTLRLWRGGVEVEMWSNGRRVTRRCTYRDIETSRTNPLLAAIDACSSALAKD